MSDEIIGTKYSMGFRSKITDGIVDIERHE